MKTRSPRYCCRFGETEREYTPGSARAATAGSAALMLGVTQVTLPSSESCAGTMALPDAPDHLHR